MKSEDRFISLCIEFLSCVLFGTKINKALVSGSLIRSSTMTIWVPTFLLFLFFVKAYLAVTLLRAFSYHIIKLRQTFSPAPGTSCS